MTPRYVLLLAALAVAATVADRASAADTARRPNVLWIIAEDLSPDIGCYGEKLVHTPNLDKLAALGVRYTRAFTTAPVWYPAAWSRSANVVTEAGRWFVSDVAPASVG